MRKGLPPLLRRKKNSDPCIIIFMDPLFLLAGLIAVLLLLALTPVFLVWFIPLRASIRVKVQDEIVREAFTLSWGPVGVRVRHDLAGNVAELLAGRHVLFAVPLVAGEDVAGAPAAPGGEKPPVGDQPTVQVPSADQPPVQTSPMDPSLPRSGTLRTILGRLVPPLESLASTFWQESRFDEVRGKVTLGLGDPVLTGELYGYYWAGRFVLDAMRIHIEVEPVFDREIVACDLELRMSLRHPLRILVAAIRLLIHPAVREMAAALRPVQPAGAAQSGGTAV
jgi:hypothetical protein